VANYLQTRLDLLRRSQNRDGGWGYFPGKQSWLEPSVYAALALHGEHAAERAWQLLLSWQNSGDGSWRPSQEVATSTWGTALCVTLAAVRQESGRALQDGASWLLDAEGAESSLTYRLSNRRSGRLAGTRPASGPSPKGWSWTKNSFSAAEPTAHAMIALKKAARLAGAVMHPGILAERLRLGEMRLMAGKNPASAGFVLLGLQGRSDLEAWLEPARRQLTGDQTPALTRAWIRLALRLRGEQLPAAHASGSNDLMLAALEALAEADGNHGLLRATGSGTTV
jgi:hypothetical protein